jgi:transcriptional regulator with XRE-family HTH domain
LAFDQKAFYREVGIRLQAIRKRRELTQEEVATELGVSRASYANVESGRQRASLDLMWKLSVLFGVPLSDFVPEPIRGSQSPRSWEGRVGETSTAYTVILPSTGLVTDTRTSKGPLDAKGRR